MLKEYLSTNFSLALLDPEVDNFLSNTIVTFENRNRAPKQGNFEWIKNTSNLQVTHSKLSNWLLGVNNEYLARLSGVKQAKKLRLG